MGQDSPEVPEGTESETQVSKQKLREEETPRLLSCLSQAFPYTNRDPSPSRHSSEQFGKKS